MLTIPSHRKEQALERFATSKECFRDTLLWVGSSGESNKFIFFLITFLEERRED